MYANKERASVVRLLSHPSPDEGGRLLPAIDGGGRRGEGDRVAMQLNEPHLLSADPIRHQAQRDAVDHCVIWTSYVPQ